MEQILEWEWLLTQQFLFLRTMEKNQLNLILNRLIIWVLNQV